MATFKIKVVTYEEKVLEQEAEFVLVRTTEGDMGILPNHSPFIADLMEKKRNTLFQKDY